MKNLPSAATLIDFAERALATFAQAFLAAVTLGTTTKLDDLKLAAIAGGYSVGKLLLVKANQFLSSKP